jgi:hypothetical protein
MTNGWTSRLARTGRAALLLALLGWVGAQAQPPERGEMKTVRGKVTSFTTAPKGEIDGAVLDDGTVLHWPPHLEDRFKGIIAKGDRVEAVGQMETGPKGDDAHLEVSTLTNLRTGVARTNPDRPPAPPDRAAPGKVRSIEDRVQSLEDRIDQLTQEIERLQRKK